MALSAWPDTLENPSSCDSIMDTSRSFLRGLFTQRVWPFTVAGVSLLLASLFVFFRLGRAQQIAGIVAFVFLGLGVLFGVIEEFLPSRVRRTRQLLVVLALGLLVVESAFLFRRGAPPPAQTEERTEIASEDFVRFTGTLALAKRHAADMSAPPLLRATPDQPVEREISFTAPKDGQYRLAVQMTDSPFADAAQKKSDYLALVGTGRTVGQTFRVSERVTKLAGIRVKLEARSLPNNMPATSAPDAPLIASFSSVTGGKQTQVQVSPAEAGLNDAWRFVTLPFEVDLTGNTTFAVEFTSASDTIGWALAHVTRSFEGTDDFYPDGELFVNREVYAPGGDLVFEILGRNAQSAPPEILVDETPLSLTPTDDDHNWFVSEPLSLREDGTHSLMVRSSNPHISVYRFVFVQEQAPVAAPVEEETQETPRATPASR